MNSIVKANRIPELAAYNSMIIEYVKDNVKSLLNEKQSQNLLSFVELVPNEVCADFWKKFNAECRDVSQKWYKESKVSKRVKDRIIGVLANPETIKKK